MEDSTLPRPYACAGPSCTAVGALTCQACSLVTYCGRDCQKAHWPTHKEDCKHPLLQSDWRPRWELRNGRPSFGQYEWPIRSFETKYLWGNVPAYDMLQLGKNEGSDLDRHLSLLLAASGDLRNVIKTINAVPQEYKGKLSIVMNDREPLVVARNFAMLCLLLEDGNAQEAAAHIAHLWYSAFIPQALLGRLQGDIKSAVTSFCDEIKGKPVESVQSKTFHFGPRQLRMVLKRKTWLSLRAHLYASAPSFARAKDNRLAVTMAPERMDTCDNDAFSQTPSRRFCELRFRQNGVLLPFGASSEAFKIPNPTLFDESGLWYLLDNASPLLGWHGADVKKARGAAANDAYGKLYFYLVDLLSSVHAKVRGLDVEFALYGDKAEDLHRRLGDAKFDRIETSNLGDIMFLGPGETVACMQGLLKPPSMNPHATIITLFQNAVQQTLAAQQILGIAPPTDPEENEKATKLAERCLPVTGQDPKRRLTDKLRQDSLKQIFRRSDLYFEGFLQAVVEPQLERREMLVEIKSSNTIIDPWPLHFTTYSPHDDVVEVFLEMPGTGWERYLEWQYAR